MEPNSARTPPTSDTLSCMLASDAAAKFGISKRRIKSRIKAMEQRRVPYETRWKAIRRFQLPHIGKFEGLDYDGNEANRKDLEIYHGCAWDSAQVFAAGVMSGLTPPSRKWFRLNFANAQVLSQSDAGKLLDQRMDIMNDVLEKSNFYTAIHSCYLELPFGQAPLGIFPDEEHGVHFVPYTVGTYCLDCGPDGEVNTFCLKYRMSAQQLADKFGEDNLTHSVKQQLHNGNAMKADHVVYWYVEPNRAHDKEKLGKFFMPYLSVYFLEASNEDEYLYIGGFEEWPVPVARYLITGNDVYAKGPGWFAEADSKGLQLLEKDMLTAVELGVRPPMLTTADNVVKGINLVPGGKTYTQQAGGITPLFQVQLDLNHLQQKINELTDRIKRAYSADLFLMLNSVDDKTMTAREVLERTQEKMQQLGPVVQRMQFEFLSPIIERTYNILERAHIFPEPDDPQLQLLLSQQEVKIEYISPLAQAQKMSGLVNLEQMLAFVGQEAQFYPDILDKLDPVEITNRYCEMVGAPAAIMRPDDEYQQIQQAKREKLAQQEQMQQAMAAAQPMAQAAQAAKNVTEAANDGNPALQQLMGMNTVGAGESEF